MDKDIKELLKSHYANLKGIFRDLIGQKNYDKIRQVKLERELIKHEKYHDRLILYKNFYTREGSDDSKIIDECYDYIIPKKHLKTVIDIGSHIGAFSKRISRQSDRVYAIEPCKANYELMLKNVELNKSYNIWNFHFGLAKRHEIRRLYKSPYSTGAYGIYHNEPTRYEDILCITFDEFIDSQELKQIDLLKIDCEGAEYEILFNMSKENLKKIKSIIMECHDAQGFDYEDMDKFLKESGFKTKLKKNKCNENYYIYAEKK